MVVLKNGVVVRHPAGPKSVVGVSPYSRTIRRVTRLLLRDARDSITFEELEARYLELCRSSLGETEDFAKVLDDDFNELKSAHEKGLPDDHPESFRAQIRYLLEQLKPQRKKRSGVAAGPEDIVTRHDADALSGRHHRAMCFRVVRYTEYRPGQHRRG